MNTQSLDSEDFVEAVARRVVELLETGGRRTRFVTASELAREFSQRVVPLFEAGRLQPVVDRVLPFEQIRDAHTLMQSNKTFGKIVLRWE